MTDIRILHPVETLTPEQERVAQAIAAGPRGGVRLPFQLLLNSPLLAETVSPVGEYLRYRSDLPATVREAAILVTAHEYQCQYEWESHHKIALEVGLPRDLIGEIRETTTSMDDGSAERLAIEFCRALLRTRKAPPALQERAIERFGSRGVADLVGLCGYYGMLGLIINLATED